jgi:hypothetical protein
MVRGKMTAGGRPAGVGPVIPGPAAQQVNKAGQNVNAPEHRKVVEALQGKANEYKAAGKVAEANVKVRNETTVWIPGPWSK